MRAYLKNYMQELEIKVEVNFIDTPRYSPDFNLAEYMIHQIRLQILHHQPTGMKLPEIEERLKRKMKEKQLLTKEQINNTVQHILRLAG